MDAGLASVVREDDTNKRSGMDAGLIFVVREDDINKHYGMDAVSRSAGVMAGRWGFLDENFIELLPYVDFYRYTSQLTCWSRPRSWSTYREMRRRMRFEFAGRGSALASQRHHGHNLLVTFSA
jgi:hypothetical protein